MKNKRGQTVQDRITEDIDHAERVEPPECRGVLATRALGAADLALEFGLITYNEWEIHIERIFKIA